MTRDDEVCLKLGREIVRMIRDVRSVAGNETGYARRKFTFPGGGVHVLIANDSELADLMELAASGKYNVQTAVPPSTKN